jgi:hypothetical protein
MGSTGYARTGPLGVDPGDEALEEYEDALIAKYRRLVGGYLTYYDNPVGNQLDW